MSKWDVARALKVSDLPSAAKLIMWDLLDSADVDSAAVPGQFTPSLTDLARTTSLGRSTVKRELNRLEAGGWVVRDRPDPAKARTEFARTGYQLAVPPRPTVDPGPEPRPTVDLDLGPERAVPRPTAGHIPSSYQSDLDPSTDDDQILTGQQNAREIDTVVRGIYERTGTTVDRPWATTVRDQILPESRRAHVGDPVAYLDKAIRSEPDPRGRFLPSLHDTPTADPAPLPPWCGRCGVEAGHDPAGIRLNKRLRTVHGRPCEACHPDRAGPERLTPAA